jgi:hypothetical protein
MISFKYPEDTKVSLGSRILLSEPQRKDLNWRLGDISKEMVKDKK